MQTLMVSETPHAGGHGPIGFLRRHCKSIQIGAAIALAFVMGLAVDNYRATNDALVGQSNYFVHRYTPQVAARAAGDAVRKAKQGCALGE